MNRVKYYPANASALPAILMAVALAHPVVGRASQKKGAVMRLNGAKQGLSVAQMDKAMLARGWVRQRS